MPNNSKLDLTDNTFSYSEKSIYNRNVYSSQNSFYVSEWYTISIFFMHLVLKKGLETAASDAQAAASTAEDSIAKLNEELKAYCPARGHVYTAKRSYQKVI